MSGHKKYFYSIIRFMHHRGVASHFHLLAGGNIAQEGYYTGEPKRPVLPVADK